jgi:hypothetical protein
MWQLDECQAPIVVRNNRLGRQPQTSMTCIQLLNSRLFFANVEQEKHKGQCCKECYRKSAFGAKAFEYRYSGIDEKDDIAGLYFL